MFASPRTHTLAAVIAIIAVGLFSRGILFPGETGLNGSPVMIAVEHEAPAILDLRVSDTGRRIGGVAELTAKGRETLFISLPESWVKREVRNGAPSSVAAETPSLGFRRWSLAPHVTASFALPVNLSAITVQNPSKIPLEIRLTRVHLDSGKAEKGVTLIKDQPAELW